MPKEYTACVKSNINRGKSTKDAQRICAIAYYKRHGRTPQQDEKKASFSEYEEQLFNIIPFIDKAFDARKPKKNKKV